jgi:hypothetical protein
VALRCVLSQSWLRVCLWVRPRLQLQLRLHLRMQVRPRSQLQVHLWLRMQCLLCLYRGFLDLYCLVAGDRVVSWVHSL